VRAIKYLLYASMIPLGWGIFLIAEAIGGESALARGVAGVSLLIIAMGGILVFHLVWENLRASFARRNRIH
jgi:hypothetical protein